MGGLEIFMAEPEKALIDSALFHRVSFSEISEMVEKKSPINRHGKIAQLSD